MMTARYLRHPAVALIYVKTAPRHHVRLNPDSEE